MYSDDDANPANSEAQNAKRRRLQHACDSCRKKKVKCDSAEMPGKRCSHCISFNLECLHTEPVKKRGPKSGYVEQLERRIQSLEEQLKKAQSERRTSEEPSSSRSHPGIFNLRGSQSPISNHSPLVFHGSADSPSSTDASTKNDTEDLEHIALSEQLERLELRAVHDRFFGPSSAFYLVRKAMSVKSNHIGVDQSEPTKRPVYWNMQPWERASAARWAPHYYFPDPDLQASLIDLFFARVHVFYPFIHEPTFRHNVRQKLHLRNYEFAALVLAMCALSSRFSDDPRVFENVGSSHYKLSAGWKWFDQIPLMRKSLFNVTSLYELQVHCLASMYYVGTSTPQAGWLLAGIGLRLAEELGLHRRKPEGTPLTVEDEMKRRTFWTLITMDRITCSFSGRACVMRTEDYDVEWPVEVDDEYWEHSDPEQRFKQPEGKPAKAAYFCRFVELCEILSDALRTLYSLQKTRSRMGLADQQLVSQLDSALNLWSDTVPDHLRWDPHREDPVFMKQSQALYGTFYLVQIQVHRPFVIKEDSPLSFPSMAICTNAARACSHVFQNYGPDAHPIPIMMTAFSAGIVLLMNVWGYQRSMISINIAKELADVEKCITLVKRFEPRWHVAGRLSDLLQQLLPTNGQVDIPRPLAEPSRKRDRSGPSSYSPPVVSFTSSLSGALEPVDVPKASLYQGPTHTPYTPSNLANPYPQSDTRWSSRSSMGDTVLPISQSHSQYHTTQYESPPLDKFVPVAPVFPTLTDDFANVDPEAFNIWMNAPPGYHLDDWGNLQGMIQPAGPQIQHSYPQHNLYHHQ